MGKGWCVLAFGLSAGALAVPASARAGCSMGKLVELKVTMLGNSPTVPVTINGSEQRFLVDSGAFHSNIAAGKATELGIPLSSLPDGFFLTGVGGEVRPMLGVVKQVGLAGMTLKNMQFVVGGSEIWNGAAGLLGQNVLGFADVEYDFAHGAVRLMRMKGCSGNTVPVYWTKTKPISMVPLETTGDGRLARATVGTVFINGMRMRAAFDTGASRTTLSLAAAARLGLKPGGQGVEPDGYGYGIGRKRIASYRMPIESFKIGDNEEVRRTHLSAEAMNLDVDMLIGADFFLSHRVYVANGLHRLFFTYEGGPTFGGQGRHIDTTGKTVADEVDTTAAPADAAGYARRGAAALSRRETAAGLADLDKAVAMAPDDPHLLVLRAKALAETDQVHRALDDLDHAVKISPADAEARLDRATLRFGTKDIKGAAADAAELSRALPPAADARLSLAEIYDGLDDRRQALAEYDLWLRYHREDHRVPTALNNRCWARAQLGIELDRALADCNAALRAHPGEADILDSRALVELRMGDLVKARRDYDAVIAKEPKAAWSLYGRGIVRRRSGDRAGGDADTAAATAIDRTLPGRVAAIGLKD